MTEDIAERTAREERTGAVSDVTVRPLRSADDEAYRFLLTRAPSAMFYHTPAYRDLLTRVVEGEPRYLVAEEGNQLVGALPMFVRDGPVGRVGNSLPFFGTPAGPAVDGRLDASVRRRVRNALLAALDDLAAADGWCVSTVISSHFEPQHGDDLAFDAVLPVAVRRDRIAQVVEFDRPDSLEAGDGPPSETPERAAEATSVEEYLFTLFERRTRRAVRKSYEAGLELERTTDVSDLYRMHVAGMEAKGGRSKPRAFFEAVPDIVPDEQYDLVYATLGGERVAGLLTFRHGETVEYFTPAYDPEHKSTQATSRLIFEGMCDAVVDGVTRWNFGGTRSTQEGLYRFKRGWGAVEYPYHYYVSTHDDDGAVRNASRRTLEDGYPWYYVFPYDRLGGDGPGKTAGSPK